MPTTTAQSPRGPHCYHHTAASVVPGPSQLLALQMVKSQHPSAPGSREGGKGQEHLPQPEGLHTEWRAEEEEGAQSSPEGIMGEAGSKLLGRVVMSGSQGLGAGGSKDPFTCVRSLPFHQSSGDSSHKNQCMHVQSSFQGFVRQISQMGASFMLLSWASIRPWERTVHQQLTFLGSSSRAGAGSSLHQEHSCGISP